MAKSSDAALPEGVGRIVFSQKKWINYHSGRSVYLDQHGVCAGLCADYARFNLKRNRASIYKGQDLSKVSFLNKEALRAHTGHSATVVGAAESGKQKDRDSFAKRVQFYQFLFQKGPVIAEGKITELVSFEALLKEKRCLRVCLKGGGGNHDIVVTKICDDSGNLLEYRLFDPNFGEYHAIKTIDDLDATFRVVLAKYSVDAAPFTSYAISDFEALFQGMDLLKNKRIFRFLDEMEDPMKLDKQKFQEVLAELPLQVKCYIGALMPNDPEVMKRILTLAPDELLSSGAAIYSMLEFAKRTQNVYVESFILQEELYLSVKDDLGTALHWAVQNGDFETVQALITNMRPEDIILKDAEGFTALHVAALNGNLEIARAIMKKMDRSGINVHNNEGKSALSLARESHYDDLAEFLIKENDDRFVMEKKRSQSEKRRASGYDDTLGKRSKDGYSL